MDRMGGRGRGMGPPGGKIDMRSDPDSSTHQRCCDDDCTSNTRSINVCLPPSGTIARSAETDPTEGAIPLVEFVF